MIAMYFCGLEIRLLAVCGIERSLLVSHLSCMAVFPALLLLVNALPRTFWGRERAVDRAVGGKGRELLTAISISVKNFKAEEFRYRGCRIPQRALLLKA